MFIKVGAVYNKLGQPAQALDAYEKALSIARSIEGAMGEKAILMSLAKTYEKLGQKAKAQTYYKQAATLET
ncbi:tetratricopeptide repeat protein [Anthocerotibacter panamensis]|uniref:tetratricopeptide repeat protein n=1 Tax=Anthocerotibacter panamensis TaxID=2857077 RepID=UPI001C40488B|nr:tetratricopeptide repeat protein [Anthocerotibacter panamensis]